MQTFAVETLARHYSKSPGTIGRWISEDRIEGDRDPTNRRRKLYPLSAVQDAYDKRYASQA